MKESGNIQETIKNNEHKGNNSRNNQANKISRTPTIKNNF